MGRIRYGGRIVLVRAHVDPRARAETLDVAAFARIASARTRL
jgi:hypothetical protein